MQAHGAPAAAYAGEWLYSPLTADTPSSRERVAPKDEARYRRDGCRFIKEVAQLLNLHADVYHTGAVFYHRFYLKHSFKAYPRFYMAAACLFVAGKAEEQPKKLKDLLPAVFKKYPRKQGAVPGEVPAMGQKMMLEMKMQILANERALLQTLDFDLVVKHPPEFLFKFARGLVLETGGKIPKELVQLAYRYVSDAYQTLLCLEYEPEVVAVSLLHLASTMLKMSLAVQPKSGDSPLRPGGSAVDWWEHFVPASSGHMQEIHEKIMLYYKQIGESLQHTAQPVLQALAAGASTPTHSSPASSVTSPNIVSTSRDRQKSASKMSSSSSRLRSRTSQSSQY